jgi:probable rRNA maturation factor
MTGDQIAFYVHDLYQERISEENLQKTVKAVFINGQVADSTSLTVMIVDDEHIREMNQRYRGIDKPTDVLAFPADFEDPDLESHYLGDVVLSYQRAQSHAEARGHKVEEELQLLIIHGVLHLLGYDHDTADRKEEMWSLQNRILADLGLDIVVEEG